MVWRHHGDKVSINVTAWMNLHGGIHVHHAHIHLAQKSSGEAQPNAQKSRIPARVRRRSRSTL
jgi:hypothetical protein